MLRLFSTPSTRQSATSMDRATVEAAYAPAAREALAAFDVAPTVLEPVHMAENVTFRVTDGRDGSAYVLRLHRPGYHTHEELVSERVWIRALDEAGIAVPEPVPARDGSDYVPVRVVATGERRYAGLARWVEGEILSGVLRRTGDAGACGRYYEQLGAMMASLHNRSTAWSVPPSFRRHTLDADGLIGDRPFWGPFWDHAALSESERQLLLRTRARLHAVLEELGRDPATWSVIHADMHPDNILVADDRLAIIDFDDTGFGWHHYDIAVALFRQRVQPDETLVEDAFLRGYRAVRPFAEAAAELIPLFILIRGMVQIGWYHQRPEIKPAAFDELKAFVCEQCAAFRWD
jgi:Ser/Thr protein kinase RdoA (MazF antagonist)